MLDPEGRWNSYLSRVLLGNGTQLEHDAFISGYLAGVAQTLETAVEDGLKSALGEAQEAFKHVRGAK